MWNSLQNLSAKMLTLVSVISVVTKGNVIHVFGNKVSVKEVIKGFINHWKVWILTHKLNNWIRKYINFQLLHKHKSRLQYIYNIIS